MDELRRKFDKYTSKAKNIQNISDQDKLYLYSNYKQALLGNNNKEKPSILNRVEMEKWKAWNNLKDLPSDVAMKSYIKKVKQLYFSQN